MKLWSNIFLEEALDWATCSVPLVEWRRITGEYEGTRHIAQVTFQNKDIYVALGAPNTAEEEGIHIPPWLVDHLGAEGCGETVDVVWLTQEAFPEATRIVLRPQDSAFYHADAKEELERALTRLGILRTGDTIVVPLNCLGGYEIPFDIVATEPANIVLAQGDEVIIEFEEALDSISDAPIESVEPTVVEPAGQTLGGEIRIHSNGRRWNPWRDGPWSKDSSIS
jgi:hypothetical protein